MNVNTNTRLGRTMNRMGLNALQLSKISKVPPRTIENWVIESNHRKAPRWLYRILAAHRLLKHIKRSGQQ